MSYAFLGQLHYLTEISWLHDRKYFVPQRFTRVFLFVSLAVLVVAFNSFGLLKGTPVQGLVDHNAVVMMGVFGLLAVLLFAKTVLGKVVGSGGVVVACVLLQGHFVNVVFGLLLVTLVHVFVFTGIFVWSGLRKQPNGAGYAFAALYLLVPLLCFVLPIQWSAAPTHWAQQTYNLVFSVLNTTLLNEMGHPIVVREVFTAPISLDLTRFIAVAYTYHYLNWFSKPTVIQWHKVSLQRWTVIGVVWLGTVGLHLHNYALGFVVLLGLSFAYVVLEFPLNQLSIKQLIQRTAKV